MFDELRIIMQLPRENLIMRPSERPRKPFALQKRCDIGTPEAVALSALYPIFILHFSAPQKRT
jgi:hypothetical protein